MLDQMFKVRSSNHVLEIKLLKELYRTKELDKFINATHIR